MAYSLKKANVFVVVVYFFQCSLPSQQEVAQIVFRVVFNVCKCCVVPWKQSEFIDQMRQRVLQTVLKGTQVHCV